MSPDEGAGLRPGLCFHIEPDKDAQIFHGANWWSGGDLLPMLSFLMWLLMLVSSRSGSWAAGVGRLACDERYCISGWVSV